MKFVKYLLAGLAVTALTLLGFSAPAGATTTGTEHFLLLTTDPSDSAVPTIIATGPIHAAGTDEQVSPSIDRFVFPDGNLRIHHVTDQSSVRQRFDPVTCLGTYTENGSYTVVRGTGAYKGASGSGTYHLSVDSVGCDENAPPSVFVLKINAVGPLTLPSAV
jgi:hypothetical protein